MNIFVLDRDPAKAAEYHCDKHVVKMILETAQILSTVQWELGYEAPYKPTHRHHPCTIWAGSHILNYMWTCKLGLYLCKEYTFRYGKTHKSQAIIEWLTENPPANLKDMTNKGYPDRFAMAMPEKYQSSDPVAAYREYYVRDKKDLLQYTKRPVPRWLEDYQFNINYD